MTNTSIGVVSLALEPGRDECTAVLEHRRDVERFALEVLAGLRATDRSVVSRAAVGAHDRQAGLGVGRSSQCFKCSDVKAMHDDALTT